MKPKFQTDWIDMRIKEAFNAAGKPAQLCLCQAAALGDRGAFVDQVTLPKNWDQQVTTLRVCCDPSPHRHIRDIHDDATFGDPRQVVVNHVCQVLVSMFESPHLK